MMKTKSAVCLSCFRCTGSESLALPSKRDLFFFLLGWFDSDKRLTLEDLKASDISHKRKVTKTNDYKFEKELI